MAGSSEIARQLVHIGVGGFACLLPLLSWPQAALAGASAVLFNLFILPTLAPAVFRPGDLDRRLRSGIVLYPLAVLGLILAFPHRPDIASIAWVVLAAGDGAATLIGRFVPSPRLPWHPEKSVAGLTAFVVCAAVAGVWVAHYAQSYRPLAPTWWLWVAPLAAATAAGLIETAPIRADDNISVPVTAAVVLWCLSHVDGAAWAAAWPAIQDRLPGAAAINLAVAYGGWRAGSVTPVGAAFGWGIGLVVYAGAGASGWFLLVVGFTAVVLATRAGRATKTSRGIAEERGGRRGPGNAIANTGVAAFIALLLPGATPDDAWRAALVAALVTGASDTVASEIGKAWGRTTWLVIGWRRVPPGTPGAMSLEGTAAGLAAATGLAGLAWMGQLIPGTMVAVVALAATIASYVESVLGATLEASGHLDNNALNFINTGLGATLTFAFARTLG